MGKRVKNKTKPRKNVSTKNTPLRKQNVTISFLYPNWIRGFSNGDFTTFTKNEEDFVKNLIYIIYDLIPYVYNNWGERRFGHCHSIKDLSKDRTHEARKKYLEAIQSLHPELLTLPNENSSKEDEFIEYQNGQLEDLELYQLGLEGSVRVICGKIENTLYPLLIDHHHLGYDSQYYNQEDTSKYSFCPIESKRS